MAKRTPPPFLGIRTMAEENSDVDGSMMFLSCCSAVCLLSSNLAGSPIGLMLALNLAPSFTLNEHVSTPGGVSLGRWSHKTWCLIRSNRSLSYWLRGSRLLACVMSIGCRCLCSAHCSSRSAISMPVKGTSPQPPFSLQGSASFRRISWTPYGTALAVCAASASQSSASAMV